MVYIFLNISYFQKLNCFKTLFSFLNKDISVAIHWPKTPGTADFELLKVLLFFFLFWILWFFASSLLSSQFC